eukprot:63465-Chlamydomonas_euryale.AAC.1
MQTLNPAVCNHADVKSDRAHACVAADVAVQIRSPDHQREALRSCQPATGRTGCGAQGMEAIGGRMVAFMGGNPSPMTSVTVSCVARLPRLPPYTHTHLRPIRRGTGGRGAGTA